MDELVLQGQAWKYLALRGDPRGHPGAQGGRGGPAPERRALPRHFRTLTRGEQRI